MKVARIRKEDVAKQNPPKLALVPKADAYWAEQRKQRAAADALAIARIQETIPVDSDPVSLWELSKVVDMTTQATQKLVAQIREDNPHLPLITAPSGGYYYSTDEEAVAAYKRQRLQMALTTTRRLWRGAVLPMLELTGDERLVSLYTRQFERVLTDIAELTGIQEE